MELLLKFICRLLYNKIANRVCQGLCQGKIIFPVQVGLNKSSCVIMGLQGVPGSICGHQLNGSVKKNEENNRKITNIIYLVLVIISS